MPDQPDGKPIEQPAERPSEPASGAAGHDLVPLEGSPSSPSPSSPSSSTPPVPHVPSYPPLLSDEDEDALEIGVEPEPERPPMPATPRERASAPSGESVAATEVIRPFNRSTRVEWPLAVAGCAAAIFIAACLSGQQGLFPSFTDVPVTSGFLDRAVLVLRGLLMMLLCGGCLVAGAALVQLVDRRPLGDLRSLAAQMLMISAFSLLTRIFPIGIEILKKGYDVLAPIGVAWVLVLAVFRLSPRDAGMVIGAAILSLIVLAFGSTIVWFAIWAGTNTISAAPSP
ncbi:MAG: hypothetical protein JNL80_16805 [Phycisphaerae bacterium]|jgi:hypothetical protein|nr:hypothetical protein [Phycisphaerae bacterium]